VPVSNDEVCWKCKHCVSWFYRYTIGILVWLVTLWKIWVLPVIFWNYQLQFNLVSRSPISAARISTAV
jgi:hypothetical protein